MTNPTLQEIAEQVGVTQMTVSRILTGSYVPKRADAVARAQEIKRIASDLGYRPNAAGRAMRGGRFNALGIVNPTGVTSSSVGESMLGGMLEGVAAQDMHLVFAEASVESLSGRDELPRVLREAMVDGMLVNYCVDYPDLIENIIETMYVPVVTINMKREFDNIRPDDTGGARLATEHLIELGHRRIVYVPRSARNHFSVTDREEGYVQAMSAAGLKPRVMPSPIPLHEDRELSVHVQWFRDMLSMPDRPTAVLGYSSNKGIAFAEAVRSLGMAMPDDVSFIGFAPKPPVTALISIGTVLIPENVIGRKVVDMLVEKIGHPKRRIPEVTLAMELEPGSTVGRYSS